ncbi:hypothetical protein [Cupriavidus nantongensis]|uniref:hypothetical protein n=1 Tax=Cupriavidus nantongensis TaxID=1796606 RepID=UPI002245084A|nr:hypothetical protein [Cupriavidus nantongensis]
MNRTLYLSVICIATTLAAGGCAQRSNGLASNTIQQSEQAGAQPPETSAEDSDKATLIFRANGMPMPVHFWMGPPATSCDNLESVGKVFDSGQHTILPWIARTTEVLNKGLLRTETERKRLVLSGTPVKIRGRSAIQSYSCVPRALVFTPEKGSIYLVEFLFDGKQSCSQQITDITEKNHPRRVMEAPRRSATTRYELADREC